MSRIDSAKKSYGGPFEEEDVESVKSFFRLLPFLVCIGLTFTPPNPLRRFQHSSYATFDCLMGSTYFMEYIVVLLCISFKLLQFKSSWCSYVYRALGMLSKIGIGILLLLLSRITYTVTELSLNLSTINATCSMKLKTADKAGINIYNDSSDYFTSYFFILPRLLTSFGYALVIPTSLEFVFAQCPYKMRGLIIGLLFALYEVFQGLGWYSIYLYSFIPDGKPGCEFYFSFTQIFILVGCISFFLYIKKK